MTLPWKSEETALLERLPAYVAQRRWFRSKSSGIRALRLLDALPLTAKAAIAVLEIESGGGSDRYTLPLSVQRGEVDENLAILRLSNGSTLCDALADPEALRALLDGFESKREIAGERSKLVFESDVETPLPALPRERVRNAPLSGEDQGGGAPPDLTPHPLGGEQSNSSIRYGRRYVLKLLRLLDEGESADLEMSRFLSRAGYPNAPRLEGSIRWSPNAGSPSTLGILQAFVPNEGGAWERTLERLAQLIAEHPEPPGGDVGAVLAPHTARARTLGQRTAELHLVLGRATDNPAFEPEPMTLAHQQQLAEGASALLGRALQLLRARASPSGHPSLPLWAGEVVARLRAFGRAPVGGMITRVHGDLHLGQILECGDDVVLIDFEGEPARSLAERRAKRSPLVDVAGVLRSFHYAATTALRAAGTRPWSSAWMNAWHRAVGDAFLTAYFERLSAPNLLPAEPRRALDFFLLEKCLYELGYELDNRPDWVGVPLAALEDLVHEGSLEASHEGTTDSRP